jgi:hypothetical protein
LGAEVLPERHLLFEVFNQGSHVSNLPLVLAVALLLLPVVAGGKKKVRAQLLAL